MAYQMAAAAVTLNNLEGHSPVAGLFKFNPSNICAAFYTISTRGSSALADLLVDRRQDERSTNFPHRKYAYKSADNRQINSGKVYCLPVVMNIGKIP